MTSDSSQVCCSTKLLRELGLPATRVAPEEELVDPLVTWYADVFWFERRKCLILFNPATGYAIVAPNVIRKTILSFQPVLADLLYRSLLADGFSEDAASKCSGLVRSANVAKTGSKSSRRLLTSALNSAYGGMASSVRSDVEAMTAGARLACSHYFPVKGEVPVVALSRLLHEQVPQQSFHDLRKLDVCEITAEIADIKPRIWRKLIVPSAMRLNAFHLILQCAFGWENCHLHQFEAGDLVYDDHQDTDEWEGEDERKVTTYDFLLRAGGKATYRYDFGDDWEVRLVLKGRQTDDPGPSPRCDDGARNGPPEDVGGAPGYAGMLKVLSRGKGGDFEDLKEWLPKDWEPESFSHEKVTVALQELTRSSFLF